MNPQYFDQLVQKHDDNPQFMRSDYNAIVQGILRTSSPAGTSYSNEYFNFGQFDKSYPVPYWIGARCSAAMRTHSICTIDTTHTGDAYTRVKPVKIYVKAYDENQPRTFLFTNELASCDANGVCLVPHY